MSTLTEIPQLNIDMLAAIRKAEADLAARFAEKMRVNADLGRHLVSFQANREESGHRWCKYREGFSAELIRYCIRKVGISGRILDPFAGSGTTLFVAAEQGCDAIGIELLPSSAAIIEARRAVLDADKPRVAAALRRIMAKRQWSMHGEAKSFQHLRITKGAFPADTERHLGRFLFDAGREPDELRSLLHFAALSVLEEISYTRKDGQYLRWDQRSGRCLGKKGFDKGTIPHFDEAIVRKLGQIADDLEGREQEPLLFTLDRPRPLPGNIELKVGSCLDIIPALPSESLDGLITSPPYCNRYDYTRTYALELAMLGVGEEGIRRLRQTMLSCTVENKDKDDLAQKFGDRTFHSALGAYDNQQLLALILEYLGACKEAGTINNPGIVRMVKNYFLELALLIFASAKVLKANAPFIMVNDNVRYEGVHIPVDLILSDFAKQAGLKTDAIWVLPKGKGNSSQQMGRHGRQEIRKCVYVWRKGA